MPSVFIEIARLMSDHYLGKRTEEIDPNLPPGKIIFVEKKIISRPINFSNLDIVISGRLDALVEFDDGTYGIIDFKTSDFEKNYKNLYSFQLNAYAYALDNLDFNSNKLELFKVSKKISKLGLLYFSPSNISKLSNNQISLEGETKWVEIERNEAEFLNLIKEISELLKQEKPPPPSKNCELCEYIMKCKDL